MEYQVRVVEQRGGVLPLITPLRRLPSQARCRRSIGAPTRVTPPLPSC